MSKPSEIEEMQGLYGPFTVSEKVVQQIWRRGDFDQTGLKTVSGKKICVLEHGRWNQNEGPDFKEARLSIDGEERVGDVEVHFHAEDWFSHGHDRDTNFDRVILDVVLFEPKRRLAGYHRSGEPDPEILVLLPLIHLDLEAYGLEDALIEGEGTEIPVWMEEILRMPTWEREELLYGCARQRWSQKVSFAETRIKKLGWAPACHQAALEVLGYARNREAMHRIAARHGPGDFAQMACVESVFNEERSKWRLQGIRPANQPQKRLEQYRSVCRTNPEWPDHLKEILRAAPLPSGKNTRDSRKSVSMATMRENISEDVFAGQIGESRLNTILCDAIFPLAEAYSIMEAEPYWMHWYPGDTPDQVARFLKLAQVVSQTSPRSVGLIQGALQLLLARGPR